MSSSEGRGRTKRITVELGPTELQHIDSLATIRNTTPAEIIRVAIKSFMGQERTQRFTGAE